MAKKPNEREDMVTALWSDPTPVNAKTECLKVAASKTHDTADPGTVIDYAKQLYEWVTEGHDDDLLS